MKLLVFCYLVLWTTTVAWLATLMIRPLYPEVYSSVVRVEREVAAMVPQLTPVIAFPLALFLADKVLRRKRYLTRGMALGYFLGAPLLIFLVLLLVISLATVVFAPFTFVFGFYYGLLPLILGTVIHCLGMLPLCLLPGRNLNTQASNAG